MAFLRKIMRWLARWMAPAPPRRESFYYSCLTCYDTRQITRLSDFGKMPCPVCSCRKGSNKPGHGGHSPGCCGGDC